MIKIETIRTRENVVLSRPANYRGPLSARQRNAIGSRATISSPAKRHSNGISLAGRKWPKYDNPQFILGCFGSVLLTTFFSIVQSEEPTTGHKNLVMAELLSFDQTSVC